MLYQGDKRIKIPKGSATIAALIIVGIVLTSVSAALLTSSQTIPTTGTVSTSPTPTATITPTPSPTGGTVDLGVYADSSFSTEYNSQNSITWAAVMPGQNTTKTVYVRNEGSQAVTLQLTTANLSPAGAVGKITVSWNKEGQTLAVGASLTAVLTLSVASSISGVSSYSVDVTITGTSS